MKAVSPLLFLLLFFNVTSLLPVVSTGLRVAGLWYTPMATTGQASFLVRTTTRLWANPNYYHPDLGFRCARSAP